MSKKRTFVDAGVLIAAARGKDAVASPAMTILDDPERQFVTSDFVRLEVLPKPLYHGQHEEAEFYEAFFDHAERMITSSASLVSQAEEEASEAGLSAVDALHVAAAKRGEADELVTTEGRTKPLFRARGIRIDTVLPS